MTEESLELNGDQRTVALVAYALYALGLFGLFLPVIAALIVNYLKVDDTLPLYRAHHRWMIRTFWWGLLWSLIGGVLAVIGIGFVILFAVWVWWLYRLIRGALALNENKIVTPVNRVL